MKWKWVPKSDVSKAYVFNFQTKTESLKLQDLLKGKYYLEEFKAPDGYVLPQGDAIYTQFEVGAGTYSQEALKVNNVKISIPQTEWYGGSCSYTLWLGCCRIRTCD